MLSIWTLIYVLYWSIEDKGTCSMHTILVLLSLCFLTLYISSDLLGEWIGFIFCGIIYLLYSILFLARRFLVHSPYRALVYRPFTASWIPIFPISKNLWLFTLVHIRGTLFQNLLIFLPRPYIVEGLPLISGRILD